MMMICKRKVRVDVPTGRVILEVSHPPCFMSGPSRTALSRSPRGVRLATGWVGVGAAKSVAGARAKSSEKVVKIILGVGGVVG